MMPTGVQVSVPEPPKPPAGHLGPRSPTGLPPDLGPSAQDDWHLQVVSLSGRLSEAERERAQAQSRATRLQEALAEAEEVTPFPRPVPEHR